MTVVRQLEENVERTNTDENPSHVLAQKRKHHDDFSID